MSHTLTRRRFLQAGAAGAAAAGAPAKGLADRSPSAGNLTINDDGHVFLYLNDDLTEADLRKYLQTYCRGGVSAVAYCVGDMTWPTFHPTKVGVPWTELRNPADFKLSRAHRNLDHFATLPGGYFGTAFRIIHDLGRKVLASFRMNDAHLSSARAAHVSEFWKQHAQLSLGKEYGYYGGSLNYASEVVRSHFRARVEEFVRLHPEIDGVELDAMRSPFFFPPGKGAENAPVFTQLVRDLRTFLRTEARRRNRPPYLLTINVPVTPELALESGLDVAAWDAERLFDCISHGTYQAIMNHPVRQWKNILKNGTPVYAYVNCGAQTGQYLGLEEYRAAAANAHAAGADGIYLFNYPCLFELSCQLPRPAGEAAIEHQDLQRFGQRDFTRIGQVLDEIHDPQRLRRKNKRYLFYWSKDTRYRHYAMDLASIDRGADNATLQATFPCHEGDDPAKTLILRFKIENVVRSERFDISLNGRLIDPKAIQVLYAPNGRDTRIHTVPLAPYLRYDLTLKPNQLNRGRNTLEATPAKLVEDLVGKIHLVEIELDVRFA